MKGIVFDIQKFAIHDGPGIRTAVFLKGCELRCKWCCNPESQMPAPQLAFDVNKCTHCMACIDSCSYGVLSENGNRLKVDFEKCTGCGDCIKECVPGALKIFGYETDAANVIEEVIKDKMYFDNSGGGITLTGGDPVFRHEFAFEILKLAKEKGIHTCVETSGHCKPEIMKKLSEVTDLFLFDFKHYKSESHKKYTGVPNEIILSNLDFLCQNGKDVILRCPVIPGINDTLEHFKAIAEISNKYAAILEVVIMPFHDWGFHKYELIGMRWPAIYSETISKEKKNQWINNLEKLGCSKVKQS